MNPTTTLDLASMLATAFRQAISEYHLKVVRIDDKEGLVVGSNYALHFSADRDGLDVAYIERADGTNLSSYTLRPLVMQRFTQQDRSLFGNPTTVAERRAASVAVYASGLTNRCADVLTGERSWLQRESWASGKPSMAVERALVGYL